jgi:hypothetical protein
VQVTDSYGNILNAARGTLGDVIEGQFFQRGYLRPLLWAHIRVLYDMAGGAYYEWFRGWHVVQVGLLVWLFLHLVRPRGVAGAAAVPVGLAALVGMHTFSGAIREAFPVNTFMTILLCCFAATATALGPPRWWRDVLAAVIFVFAALTVESGLLVAVVVVAAWLAGARGVSRWGAAAQVLLVAGYLLLRFVVLDVGSPGLDERSSGFGFSAKDPDELIAIFGGNPWPFYGYNVLSSVFTVLFAEPRGGVWVAVRDAVREHAYTTPNTVAVLATTLGTLLILHYVWTRRREWLARRFDRSDQLVIVFMFVTGANAIVSYPYTKDVIMSPAGAFFAVALAVAVCHRLEAASRSSVAGFALSLVLLATLSGAWATCTIAAHLGLRTAAAAMRGEWAYVDGWLERENISREPSAVALKHQLQDDAVRRYPLRPPLSGDWIQWFEGR